MEMLNSVSMLLGADLWHIIINWMAKGIVNYGWTIIVFTIVLKLILIPIDVYQRNSSQKQTKFMAIMQPELNELQKKYANDKEKLNQETSKLYKKHNVNMGGMCLSMLLPLIITLVVFFTLFSSLRNYGDQKLYSSFKSLDNAYTVALDNREIDTLSDLEKEEIRVEIREEYENLKKQNSWLWIKNVWKADSKTSQFVEYDAYVNYYGQGSMDVNKYNFIVSSIEGEKQAQNGYYILVILAVLISFATQLVSSKLMTPKGQKLNTMNKVMMCVIPLSMLLFVFTSNAVFALYIIVNSLMSAIISTIITLIINHKNKGKTDEEIVMKNKHVEVVEYSRNYKK
ncbi:MAG: membrane protein insertase YidC [Clostridia bacterium]|nr:membrane protein insertase YidC [Clostridia bacterium]